MKQPNLSTDFGWCVFKYMFIALLATNLLWAGFTVYYIHKSVGDTSVEMTVVTLTTRHIKNRVASRLPY